MIILLYILGFRRQQLPLELERLSRLQGRVIILRTPREIAAFVAAFKNVPGQP
jgi:hypothetical protein